MIILPAIDIQNGLCVRLRQGVASDATVYGDDPVEMAKKWESEGAEYLHVVDLDGAFSGEGKNTEAIRRICEAVKIPVELGGGIRSFAAAEDRFALGVSRIIIGSVALENPALAADLAAKYGADRVAVSIDAKNNVAQAHGWVDGSLKKVLPLAKELVAAGCTTIIYTDIVKDGMLSGPNLEMLIQLQRIEGISLIASGGISCIGDIKKLDEMGLYGVICGKALYEGKVTMEEIRALRK